MDFIYLNNQKVNIPENKLEKKLIEFLREDMNLTGVKNACDSGACGACAVLVDNQINKICFKKVKDVIGKKILTIEGMAESDGTLHPLQQAFIGYGAVQCGYCTPGMILTAHAYLLKNPKPSRNEIRYALRGNLCRCTGYQQIIDAIEAASVYYVEEPSG
ncbi:MAG: (2Fe-2S)-binding protein [Ignavibacteria bacterium]|nr:(2Fe-2S)-binding protein [Ignavibacteria bacterium]